MTALALALLLLAETRPAPQVLADLSWGMDDCPCLMMKPQSQKLFHAKALISALS